MAKRVISKYDKHEHFNYDNVPTRFESVTSESIQTLRDSCLARSEKMYGNKFKASALKSMLKSVCGSFNIAYAKLDGDYTERKNKLNSAYDAGLADIDAKIKDLERSISEQNNTYEEFNEIHQKIYGREIRKSLRTDQKVVDDFYKQLAQLEKAEEKW